MTKEQMAARLSGREMGNEISKDEEKLAEDSGLVVIFGHSDDNVELRGAVNDEIGCYGGGIIPLHRKGALADHEDCDCDYCGYKPMAKKCVTVMAVWGPKDGGSWGYTTSLSHASFDIMEGGELFCRGIVIDAKDLPEL